LCDTSGSACLEYVSLPGGSSIGLDICDELSYFGTARFSVLLVLLSHDQCVVYVSVHR
jgi:hypothetical protein